MCGISRCGSAWNFINPMLHVRVATRAWIRSAMRSKISTAWADGARVSILPELFRTEQGSTGPPDSGMRSEEHTSELQSLAYLVCRLLLEKKKKSISHFSN